MNNQRLSKAGEESGAVEVNSYDVVQFGVDVVDSMRKGTDTVILSFFIDCFKKALQSKEMGFLKFR